jgi:hypothetical protein
VMNIRWSKVAVLAFTVLAAIWSFGRRTVQPVSADNVGRIVPTDDTLKPRFDHTATLLPNGKVLIAAGMARNGLAEPTAELYDTSTGRFTLAGKLASPRGWGATATLLRDGKVLIAGGASGSWCSSSCYLATAELYDPAANSFTPIGNMIEQRAGARAIRLRNGNVLIVGGNISSRQTAELYDPASRTFSRTGSPLAGATTLLPLEDSDVLALSNSGAEIYDTSTGRFAPAGNFPARHGKFGAALMPDGRVLVVGGQLDGALGELDTTEIYDFATRAFLPGPVMNFKRYKLMKAIVSLSNGEILIAGGADHPELYNPLSNSFRPVSGAMLDGYCFSTATQLPNGEVLLTGGYNTSTWVAVDHAWLYQPQW